MRRVPAGSAINDLGCFPAIKSVFKYHLISETNIYIIELGNFSSITSTQIFIGITNLWCDVVVMLLGDAFL